MEVGGAWTGSLLESPGAAVVSGLLRCLFPAHGGTSYLTWRGDNGSVLTPLSTEDITPKRSVSRRKWMSHPAHWSLFHPHNMADEFIIEFILSRKPHLIKWELPMLRNSSETTIFLRFYHFFISDSTQGFVHISSYSSGFLKIWYQVTQTVISQFWNFWGIWHHSFKAAIPWKWH